MNWRLTDYLTNIREWFISDAWIPVRCECGKMIRPIYMPGHRASGHVLDEPPEDDDGLR